MNRTLIPALLLVTACLFSACRQPDRRERLERGPEWRETMERELDLLGHRNWILVTDKAFPAQSSDGMHTLYADEDLLAVLEHVLVAVEASDHVRPILYRDRELEYLTEEQVPGIGRFREESARIVDGREVRSLLHSEVFEKLDESASLFRVLVIKTRGTLPYTSFFLELDCAYWGPSQEDALRKNMMENDTPLNRHP